MVGFFLGTLRFITPAETAKLLAASARITIGEPL